MSDIPGVSKTVPKVAPEIKSSGVEVGKSDKSRAAEAVVKNFIETNKTPLDERSVETSEKSAPKLSPIHTLDADALASVISHLPISDALTMRAVNTVLRDFVTTNALGEAQINLSPDMIAKAGSLKEIFEFSVENNIKISLKLPKTDPRSTQNMIDFLSTCEKGVLNQITSIEVGEIGKTEPVQTLLGKLSSECPNLVSIDCGKIGFGTKLAIPEGFKKPIAFSCKIIDSYAELSCPKLASFSSGDINTNVDIKFLEEPGSFSCGNIFFDTKITFAGDSRNLVSFSCEKIYSRVSIVFPEGPSKLATLVHGEVADADILATLEKLKNPA